MSEPFHNLYFQVILCYSDIFLHNFCAVECRGGTGRGEGARQTPAWTQRRGIHFCPARMRRKRRKKPTQEAIMGHFGQTTLGISVSQVAAAAEPGSRQDGEDKRADHEEGEGGGSQTPA